MLGVERLTKIGKVKSTKQTFHACAWPKHSASSCAMSHTIVLTEVVLEATRKFDPYLKLTEGVAVRCSVTRARARPPQPASNRSSRSNSSFALRTRP